MLKNALLASALGLSVYALATGATASHRPQGWYLGVEGGANWIDETKLAFEPVPITGFEAEFDSGWAVIATVGKRFSGNWRLELELGYRENDVDCINFFGGACIPADFGELTQFTQMVNLVHDVPLSDSTSLSIGLGVGGNYIESNAPILVGNDDYVFAGQALVQLTHELSRSVEFVLSYRYMISNDPEFDLAGPFQVQFENENHTVTVGFRFLLDADEPSAPTQVYNAPPPGPPPAIRQYVVYFGFKKSNLTREAREVVHEAATTAMREGFASIVVTGHTDTVGSNGYNQALSERRARTVTRALVDEGIPPAGITTNGRGENMLLVATGDREVEARNRRATIDVN
jgi:outer membrane protein OmpA-like peptidoglycan-associated protein